MSRKSPKHAQKLSKLEPTPGMYVGLNLLREAHKAAVDRKLNPWDFAISIDAMRHAGVGETDLRLLLADGLAEHANEKSLARSGRRSFTPLVNLSLTTRTCFILTAAGRRAPKAAILRPRWDGERRELWYGEWLVKSYRSPAKCQEILLAVFEEEGWPARIDEPLPMDDGIDRRERLHDTIRRLNMGHKRPSLVFGRDGTGAGAIWHGLNVGQCLSV